VVIEEMKEEPEITRISRVIYVERDSQKGILIGKGGSMLKKIALSPVWTRRSCLGRRSF